jgi:hypothetical protein
MLVSFLYILVTNGLNLLVIPRIIAARKAGTVSPMTPGVVGANAFMMLLEAGAAFVLFDGSAFPFALSAALLIWLLEVYGVGNTIHACIVGKPTDPKINAVNNLLKIVCAALLFFVI